jgi:hypothetical protein
MGVSAVAHGSKHTLLTREEGMSLRRYTVEEFSNVSGIFPGRPVRTLALRAFDQMIFRGFRSLGWAPGAGFPAVPFAPRKRMKGSGGENRAAFRAADEMVGGFVFFMVLFLLCFQYRQVGIREVPARLVGHR